MNNISSLHGVLDRAVLELWEVLSAQAEDGWGVTAGKGDVIGSRSLISVSWTPGLKVGDSAQVRDSLNRLMGWTVLTETNGIVGGDPDDLVLRKSGQTDGTSGV